MKLRLNSYKITVGAVILSWELLTVSGAASGFVTWWHHHSSLFLYCKTLGEKKLWSNVSTAIYLNSIWFRMRCHFFPNSHFWEKNNMQMTINRFIYTHAHVRFNNTPTLPEISVPWYSCHTTADMCQSDLFTLVNCLKALPLDAVHPSWQQETMIRWSLFVLLEKTHTVQRENKALHSSLIMPLCEFKQWTSAP